MSIVVGHDQPSGGFDALLAMLREIAERRKAQQLAETQALAQGLTPEMLRGQRMDPREPTPSSEAQPQQAPPQQGGRDPGYTARATAFYNAAGRGGNFNNGQDPNDPYAAILRQRISSSADLQKQAMAQQASMQETVYKQNAITQRAMQEAQLKPIYDTYDYWASLKIPDEVAAQISAGRAEYTPKAMDQRNKIVASINQAQSDSSLTEAQRYTFLAQQYKALYEIDSRPTPTTPDKWVVTPQQEYDQAVIPSTGPDGLPTRKVWQNRAGGKQLALDPEDEIRIQHHNAKELKKLEVEQKSQTELAKRFSEAEGNLHKARKEKETRAKELGDAERELIGLQRTVADKKKLLDDAKAKSLENDATDEKAVKKSVDAIQKAKDAYDDAQADLNVAQANANRIKTSLGLTQAEEDAATQRYDALRPRDDDPDSDLPHPKTAAEVEQMFLNNTIPPGGEFIGPDGNKHTRKRQ